MTRRIDWTTIDPAELDPLTTDQQRAAILAIHGISQRTAAQMLGISRAAYRSRLEAATHTIRRHRNAAA